MKSTYGTMYYVDDMTKSVAYFRGLGLTVGHESPDWTEFDLSGHQLCLHAKSPGETYPANGILIIAADGIKELFEKMKGDNHNVFGLHQVHPEAWTFHLKDANNNELSFFGKP